MDIAEKRVYDASAGRTRLAVATDQGLAVVGISADVIGEFGLALAEPVRDVVAAGAGRLLVATPEDVFVVALANEEVAGTVATASTGAGPTAVIATAEDAVIAAGSDGVVRRAPLAAVLDAVDDAGNAAEPQAVEWTAIGEASVGNADGRLLAAADGVYRVSADSIDRVGLDDVRDVAAPAGGSGATAGPFAATGDGLYRLGPGWTEEQSGPWDLVSAAGSRSDPNAPQNPPRAHAAAADRLLARGEDGWTPVSWPVGSQVAGVAYAGDPDPDGSGAHDPDADESDATAPATYAVAVDGTVLADAGEGWRTRSIGLRDVAGCAVVA